MKISILIGILILAAGALLPSSMPYEIVAVCNGLCISGACLLSWALGKAQGEGLL